VFVFNVRKMMGKYRHIAQEKKGAKYNKTNPHTQRANPREDDDVDAGE
jgi:hypothetical protein